MSDNKPLAGEFAIPTLASYQQALRAAETQKAGTEPGSGWGRLVQGGVFDLTRGPMGYQSDDERKVAASSAIMNDAIAKATDAEPLDPLKHRQLVLTDVIRRFNALGYTDLVAQAMPELQSLNQQQIELRKLNGEADSAQSKARIDVATEAADIEDANLKPNATRASTDSSKASAESSRASAARARVETTSAANEGQNYQSPDGKSAINVSKLDKNTRDALRAQGWVEVNNIQRDGATLGSKKELEEYRTTAATTTDLLNSLGDLKQVAIDQPGAWTVGGKALSAVSNIKDQINYSLWQRGINPGDFNAAVGTTKEGTDTASFLTRAGISDARQQAMVLNLAYVRAKALDPGGRLSNQDVDIAMRIVRGSSPVQQIALLEDIANSAARSFDTRAAVLGIPADDTGRALVQKARDRYGSIKPAASATATTPSGRTFRVVE